MFKSSVYRGKFEKLQGNAIQVKSLLKSILFNLNKKNVSIINNDVEDAPFNQPISFEISNFSLLFLHHWKGPCGVCYLFFYSIHSEKKHKINR